MEKMRQKLLMVEGFIDLKKIEFLVKDDLLPYEILIHFKKRVFKLERI